MYTFEDWLEDKFDENSVIVKKFSADGIQVNTIRQPRNYLKILFFDGQIDASTYKKIREAQEDVFDKAIEMTVMSFEMEINNGLKIVENKKEYLKLKLAQLEKRRNNSG